jgi:uncharacterized protein YjbI with pentapeptide repeats
MRVGRRYWWILGGVGLLLCVGFILAAYRFNWPGTGFLHKTVWDWLQLLIVPFALAVVALLFQLANARTERQITKQRYEQDRQITKQRYEQDQQIALDKQREDLLQAYLDRMSELLLEKNLHTSPTEEVRNVAQVRTMTVLCQLDARRAGYVFAFLHQAGLMSAQSNDNIVSLRDTDLSSVNWSGANLSRANLNLADLGEADLSFADLSFADLRETVLYGADLHCADLSKADLNGANLLYANLSGAVLNGAILNGADLRGSILYNDDLSGADLSGADLNGAILDKTVLSAEQLALAKLHAKA